MTKNEFEKKVAAFFVSNEISRYHLSREGDSAIDFNNLLITDLKLYRLHNQKMKIPCNLLHQVNVIVITLSNSLLTGITQRKT